MRKKTITKTPVVLAFMGLIVFWSSILPWVALAGVPPPVPTSQPVPVPPAQSSGGYSPQTPSQASFQSYTIDVYDSAGLVIGNLTGIDSNKVRLLVGNASITNGEYCSVSVQADMERKPVNPTIDLNFCDKGSLPDGMDNVKFLCAVSLIAQSQYDLQLIPGTLILRFTIPVSGFVKVEQDAKYYLVYYDGAGYQIQTPGIAVENGTATIEARVPDINGIFTVIMPDPQDPKSDRTILAMLTPTSMPGVTSNLTPFFNLTGDSTGISNWWPSPGLMLLFLTNCGAIGIILWILIKK
jgi:hypothetical protein